MPESVLTEKITCIRLHCRKAECKAVTMVKVDPSWNDDYIHDKVGNYRAFECHGEGFPHMNIGRVKDHFVIGTSEITGEIIRILEEKMKPEEWFVARFQKEADDLKGKFVGETKNLPTGLRHLGFGEFESKTHRYLRRDSGHGGRYYIEVPNVVPNT